MWYFPALLYTEYLKVYDSHNPSFVVTGNTSLGNDSSDKTTVKGDLDVSGNICLDYCRSTWPSEGISCSDCDTRFVNEGQLNSITSGMVDFNYAGSSSEGGAANNAKSCNADGTCEVDDLNVSGNTQLGDSSSDKTTVKGDLEVSGGINAYNSASPPDGTIIADTFCLDGTTECVTSTWPVGGAGGPITFDVWTGNDSDSKYMGTSGIPASVSCTVSVPEGYTVIYAQKACLGGTANKAYPADLCAYPSYLYDAGGGISYPSPCYSTNIGDKGHINITASCDSGWPSGAGSYGVRANCGIYAIAVKATGGGAADNAKSCNADGTCEADNLNVSGNTQLGDSSSDKTTVKGDLEVSQGAVVGNPTGGNKGEGSINAEKVYENGSEVGGLFSECEIVNKTCINNDFWVSCEVSCPSDKWLISGGGNCNSRGDYTGLYQSYPKTAGKNGTWHVKGLGYGASGNYYIYAYALCCK